VTSPAPRVSIVIPAYNRERYLPVTLDGVRSQTFMDWEAVVFDDGSDDGTARVAKSYAADDPRIIATGGPNGGVAAARNRGFGATNGCSEFVVFLDSDDVWEPDALATLVSVLDANPEYSSCHSTARCIDDEGRPVPGDDLEERSRHRLGYRGGRLTAIASTEPTTFAELAYHNWILTPGTHLIRRAALEQAGDFDVATDPADDWDLAVRISRIGPVGFVDRPVLRWRRHPQTLTNTSPRWRRAHFLVRTKMLTDRSNTPDQTRAARLAFVGASQSTWRQAWDLAVRRDFKGALRQGAKAIHHTLLYLRADLTTRLRRS
jgi:glycosyltransferase involved in cell wall biosynthesis